MNRGINGSALDRFKKYTPEHRALVVTRVNAGLTDRPKGHDEMCAIVEADKAGSSQLPGGVSRQERAAYEARVRAGMVDLPGDEERWRAEREARSAAEKRRGSLGGYVPSFPWQKF